MIKDTKIVDVVVVNKTPDQAAIRKMIKHALGVTISGDYNWHDYMNDLYKIATNQEVQ